MRSSLFQLLNDNYSNYASDFHVEDKEKAYQLELDIPGIKREDLSIEVHNQILTIVGERKGSRSQTFERRFRLSDDVMADEIQATLVDGVLTLDLVKAEKARSRKIAIAS
jgi:HSP20 family protein